MASKIMVDDPYDSCDDSVIDDNNIWYINTFRSIYIHTVLVKMNNFKSIYPFEIEGHYNISGYQMLSVTIIKNLESNYE